MSPSGHFDHESALQIIEATKNLTSQPPGRVETHFDKTAYFREVHETEKRVLDALKEYMQKLPAYDPDFFRVAEPASPLYEQKDLYYLLQAEPKKIYDSLQILARLVDGSEFMEYQPEYGPEVMAGLGKINGLPVGIIGNRQGFFLNYPENSVGLGGKLYRQGLIKMNEFVTMCGRDNCL